MEKKFNISGGVTFDTTRGRTPLLDALRKERQTAVLWPAQSRIRAVCVFLPIAKVLRTGLGPVKSGSCMF